MTDGNGSDNKSESTGRDDDDQWFDEVHIVDDEWVALDVTTPQGEAVRYRVPRKTLFESIDR